MGAKRLHKLEGEPPPRQLTPFYWEQGKCEQLHSKTVVFLFFLSSALLATFAIRFLWLDALNTTHRTIKIGQIEAVVTIHPS